jgi:hypothetical protein
MDILVIGQSNAAGWFTGGGHSAAHPAAFSWNGRTWGRPVGEGAVALSATLADASGEPIRLLNAAVGSTSLLPVLGANWLATGSSSLYGRMLTEVRESGLQPDAIVWVQGESDALARVSSSAYRAGLDTFFDRIEASFGEVPVILQPLILSMTGKDAVLAAQQSFAAAHGNVRLLAPAMELPARDALHFTPVSYSALGDLAARELLSALSNPGADPIRQGSAGADVYRGSDGADRMYAGAGDDTVHAEGGNDVLMGEQGADRLRAAGGNDLVSGGSGNDTLEGGAGSDLLWGDAGSDQFVFTERPSADRVADFTPGSDRLVFDPSVYDIGRLAYNRATGQISYQGELVLTLQNSPVLRAGDITSELPPAAASPSGGAEGEGDAMSGVVAAAGAALGLLSWLL